VLTPRTLRVREQIGVSLRHERAAVSQNDWDRGSLDGHLQGAP